MKRITRLLFLFISVLSAGVAFSAVKLPAVISSGMVLQQKTKVALWGNADAGEKIRVLASWSKKEMSLSADENGKWKVFLQTPKAGGPYTITIKAANTIILNNILIGEVWLCSGQSNMAFPLQKESRWRTGVLNGEQEIKSADYPSIRLFQVTQSTADQPQDDLTGNWQVCSPATVGGFSAVAYFFGRELYRQLGVPIGLIQASWGGTPAEAWTNRKTLESDPRFKPILNRYDSIMGAKVPESKNQLPTQLYNAMIHPLIHYSIRGVIWYQGESNASRAYQYRSLFPAMIQNWRSDWKSEFPFYFVQIAPHKSQHPEIREAQLLTFRNVKNTGMAVITDAGDSSDIHPRNKRIVGERLSKWALARQYGKKIPYSGPLYKKMKSENGTIRIYFDFAESGFTEKELDGFTIAGSDQVFYPAKAVVDGKTLIVSSPSVKDPVAVRYNWSNFFRTNFYNKEGLPASPFRTDSWPGETEGNE